MVEVADYPVPAVHKRLRDFTAAEREEFEALIRDYLLRNPSIIREAVTALAKRMDQSHAGPRFQNPSACGIPAADRT